MNLMPLYHKDDPPTPESAKQLSVQSCELELAILFNEMHHSRLPKVIASNIYRNTHWQAYSAEHSHYLYATAIWSSPVALNRMVRKDVLELRRLAICEKAPKYTATYMIGKMVNDIKRRFPSIGLLISYQDTEVHKGTIYSASNWKRGVESKLNDWSNRNRNKEQTTSTKIRWEYELRRRAQATP
jgi:hypothetical protein